MQKKWRSGQRKDKFLAKEIRYDSLKEIAEGLASDFNERFDWKTDRRGKTLLMIQEDFIGGLNRLERNSVYRPFVEKVLRPHCGKKTRKNLLASLSKSVIPDITAKILTGIIEVNAQIYPGFLDKKNKQESKARPFNKAAKGFF